MSVLLDGASLTSSSILKFIFVNFRNLLVTVIHPWKIRKSKQLKCFFLLSLPFVFHGVFFFFGSFLSQLIK
jgi:hypothetical protein